MRISYYSDTDTLYIEFNEAHGTDSRDCAKDMVVDLGPNGEAIGIEIEHASEKVDLSRLKTKGLNMRITYDPVISTRDVLLDDEYPLLETSMGTRFLLEMAGNGESGRAVSEQLSKQTELALGEYLR